ncbi:MAG: hypothetical protein WCN98_17215 [Verrucomicrobiaceae bacterium]
MSSPVKVITGAANTYFVRTFVRVKTGVADLFGGVYFSAAWSDGR